MLPLISAFIGAIIGGFFTIFGNKVRLDMEKRRRVRALSAALATEIGAVIELARRNGYAKELRSLARQIEDPAFTGELPRFIAEVNQSYFKVFEANAAHIGELDTRLTVEIIMFYAQARSWVDSLATVSKFQSIGVSGTTAADYYRRMAKSLVRLCHFGDGLAARVAPPDLSKHIIHTVRALDINTLGIEEVDHVDRGRAHDREKALGLGDV